MVVDMFDISTTTDQYMSVVLTHECNKRCPFCIDQYRGRKEFISLTDVRAAINFAKGMGIKDILLVGGEPTLHPDVVEIAKLFKAAGLKTILTTNFSKPEVFYALDDIIDCFNVSFYEQECLPIQSFIKSDLTLTTLIHGKQLETKEKLDKFIDNAKLFGAHLKFSTLSVCNEWTQKNQSVPYLDELDCERVVLFNEIIGMLYRGTVIKRYDLVVNKKAKQSYKFHVDGRISQTWDRA